MPSPALPIRRVLRNGTALFALSAGLPVLPALAQDAADVPVFDVSGGEAVDLGTLVVTAAGFEQNVENAPASISVVPGETLEDERFTDLSDALSGVQGVVTTGIANEEDIFIRGLGGQYTLILIDGRRQGTRESRPNGSSGYEQRFVPPPAAIDRIEVVRGPMSSLYGSDAIGGVINIITKPVADEWSGQVSVGTDIPQDDDFGDEQRLDFYLSGPVVSDRLGLQLWGWRLDQDGAQIPGARNEGDEYNLTGRLSLRASPDHDFYAEIGTTRIEDIEPDRLRISENRSDTYALGYDGRIGAWDLEADLQHEYGERQRLGRESADLDFEEDPRSPEIRDTTLDVRATRPFQLAGTHTLTLGTQIIESELTDQNPGTVSEADETFDIGQSAIFVEDEWQLTDTFALTAGIRLNRHDEYDDNVTPRIYGVWNATEALTIKGGISTGFRAPGIRQIAPGYLYTTGGRSCVLDPTAEQPCGVIVGDPDLQAEESTNYEIGALWTQSGLSFGATYFRNDFENKIESDRIYNEDGTFAIYPQDPRYTLFYWRNVGEAQIEGVELTAEWQAGDRFNLRGTYTYTDSEQLTGQYAGYPLERTPEHLASLRADYETAMPGLAVWGEATYHGEEVNAGLRIGSDGDPLSDDEGNVLARSYDSYTLVDTGINYEVRDNVTLSGAVYNVFDEEVREGEFGTVRKGRSFWFGATTSF